MNTKETRKFLGVIPKSLKQLMETPPLSERKFKTDEEKLSATRTQRNFHNKHLKAYLRGFAKFTFMGNKYNVLEKISART